MRPEGYPSPFPGGGPAPTLGIHLTPPSPSSAASCIPYRLSPSCCPLYVPSSPLPSHQLPLVLAHQQHVLDQRRAGDCTLDGLRLNLRTSEGGGRGRTCSALSK